MALRFDFPKQKPTVEMLAKKTGCSIDPVIAAVKHSWRLHRGITKEKYFLPEAAGEEKEWKESAIRCSRGVPQEEHEETEQEDVPREEPEETDHKERR